ncbi:lipocalin family protein [Pseudobacter ginsenosidimutans]|uniref:Lipocalin-like protein n=1 Tax=Pseudobacter ginsenosidimutans TaxID=661488 RepID=A0A4Q7MS33_9BACT|nr:lipocalin family protein [Pseudobacter ginsenosidimutans]QEC41905.1 hypothetical protein FSB84_09485 [Pseudobacter ginsenosidimutans]RZS71268.1 lipocalin-like protein [Pseudobacter ginsenosidimutans]
MKKHMLRLTLLAFVTLSVFSSCKKDKDDDKLAVNAENLIGNYKLADLKMKVSGVGEESILSEFEECEKDDVYQLLANNVFKVVDEGKKCENDETTEWSLNGNKITLETSAFFIYGDFEVVSLTKSQLVLSLTMSEGGNTITYTVILKR